MVRKSRFEAPFVLLRGLSKIILRLGFGFEVRGLEHLRTIGQVQRHTCPDGLILAGNHTGYLDSLAVLAACQRKFYFLMTHEVFSWRWVGHLVPYGNIIPLYAGREKRALVNAVRLLSQGGAVCIFPEGKLSPDGQMGAFNSGVAYLQEKSGAPILPFAICGGYEAWPEGRPPGIGNKIVLVFGETIWPAEFNSREALTEAVRQRVQHLQQEYSPVKPNNPVDNRFPSPVC